MPDSLPIALTSPLSRAQQTALINLVRRTARAEIMPRFRNLGHADISAKTDRFDLVTEADLAAEAMLARGIQRMFPQALVVGEEAAAADPDLAAKLSEAELAFIIDPVDGTWNFVHGLPLFGVIIAVTRFGRPVLGLLHDPVSDDWIIADETNPARLAAVLGSERPVRVSKGGDLADLQGYMHFYLMPQDQQERIAPLLAALARCFALRCSCHEYRLLAQGAVDFTLSGVLNPWDHAAGVLICQQAGGVARMLDGRDYNTAITKGFLLCASNQATWDRLRDHFTCLLED